MKDPVLRLLAFLARVAVAHPSWAMAIGVTTYTVGKRVRDQRLRETQEVRDADTDTEATRGAETAAADASTDPVEERIRAAAKQHLEQQIRRTM